MSIDGYLTLAITGATILALAMELAPPEVLLVAAVTLLMVAGVLTPEQAAAGFGSVTVLTIAALFIIGEAIRRTGVLTYLADVLLGVKGRREPLLRLMVPAAALSSFFNNTLVVAILVPAVIDWCKRNDTAPSRMLMPLSFATILGGVCTLIGTSTNLVVDGFMTARGLAHLRMFELTWVGVPLTGAGILAMWLFAGRLLPDRRDPVTTLSEDQRQFLVEVLVDPNSRLVGRTIAEAGLRNLPGLFVVNLGRAGKFLGPVGPDETLLGDDRLVLAGIADSVVALRRFPGLVPAPEAHYDPLAADRRDHLFEVVVSPSSPLVGTTIRDLGFRSRYDAAVIAVHRAGRRVEEKLGEIILRAGDTLMLEAEDAFASRWTSSGDFALVSRVNAEPSPKLSKAPHAIAIVTAMVVVVAAGWLPILPAVMTAVGLLFATRVLTTSEARRALRLAVLLTIAGALALGHALETSGAAAGLAGYLIDLADNVGPYGLLAMTVLLSVLLSAVVTNVAAAAMVFPVVIDIALLAGYSPRPFAIAVAIGCSASFLTPFGYQTNLMVYGPGGYKFSDFARLGVPLTLVIIAGTVALVPLVWPLFG